MSCKVLRDGSTFSAIPMKINNKTMAAPAAIKPFIIAFIFKGRAMKFRLAQTICSVFIKKRLMYIAKRIVLTITIITRIEKIRVS